MNLRQIEVFQAVYMAQSISGGARQLNISQPSVSRMIQYMEDQLGYRLFERSTRRLSPTHQASVLFRETEGIFERVRRASEFAKSLKKGAGERLSVLSYYSSAMTTVPRVMHEVSKRYPDMAFSLDARNPGSQIAEIIRADADVGIAGNVPHLASLQQLPLATDKIVAVITADHPLASKSSLSLEDISAYICITSPPSSPVGKMLSVAFERQGIELKRQISIGSPVPVNELVRLFGGVALIGFMAAWEMTAGSQLVMKELDIVIEYPVTAFWSVNAAPSEARDYFLEVLTAAFAATGN